MLTGEKLGAAIEHARKMKGVTKSAFANAMGVKPASVQDWVKYGRIAKERISDLVEYFSDVVGPEHWGLDFVAQRPGVGVAKLPADKGNVLVWESESDLPDDPSRVWIDRYDYRFSAGDGTVQWEVREKRALPFDGGFFQKIGSRPQDCKLCIVRGDSMEPYLFNRDMMMVDSAKTSIRDGRVYAVIFEDEALVKQVFKQIGGSLVLHSYNSPKYPDKEIPADKLEYLKIAGEVIYRSGTGPAGGN